MLTKKHAMPVAYMDCVHFSVAGRVNERPRSLQLIDFKVEKGRLTWAMQTDDGKIVTGNADAEVPNPLFPGRTDVWIKPAIPITMHTRGGLLKLQMIFMVPNACYIKVLPPKGANA